MKNSSSRRRVVVTGYGMVTPLGRNTEDTFSNARRGQSGIDYITAFDTTGLPCRIGGQIDDRWLEGVEDDYARRFDKVSSRALRLMRIASLEASRRARLEEVKNRERVGVSLGSHGDTPSIEDMMFTHRFLNDDGSWDIKRLMKAGGYSYLNFFRRKPDAAMSILSVLFDCKGANASIVSACAAGAQAIGEAHRTIQEGRCDVMIAGGCEADLNFTGFVGFVLIRALSEKYASPREASRPFDRKRNGFVMSEGAGAVILEELEHARSRSVPILGELLGYGASADAYRITDTHPRGTGAVYAMKGALADASLVPEDIDYINAHGTSTIQNDIGETRAIKEVFREHAKEIPVSANKSMLGHTIAAAGAIEFILTLEGIRRAVILPTINYEFRDPKCNLDYVPNEARERDHRRALSNSFGFGGQNACLCVGAFEE
jgi:3-oxoacyl-[acyl-carrier-protein] synthase II